MTMSNDSTTTSGDSIYEAPTRKPVDIGGEAFIAFRFLRACTFASLSLTEGAVLIGGTLGEEDLNEKFSPDGVEVKAGTFLVLNVRNEGDHAQEIVATIHAHGEHGAEAEVIPLFANGSPLDSVRRDSTANGAPRPRGIPPIAPNERPREAGLERQGAGREAAKSDAAVSSRGGSLPLKAEIKDLSPSTGATRLLLFRPDVEALLSVFELGAPLSEMTRASLDSQLAAGPVSDEVTSSQNDVILTLAAVDVERLSEAIRFHQEYDLEDTGILIGLQVALGLIEQTTSGPRSGEKRGVSLGDSDTVEDEVTTSEPRGEEKEEKDFRLALAPANAGARPASQARSLEANEGSSLSIASDEMRGSDPDDGNGNLKIDPHDGHEGQNGEGRDEHSSAVS